MPSGLAVAAIWDPKKRDYLALSRPFEVRAGETVEAPLERPGRNPHLVVELERRTLSRKADLDRLELEPDGGGDPASGVTMSSADRLYGIWYDLEPRPMRLSAASAEDFLTPLVIDLAPRRAEHIEAALQPRPTLDVEVILPAEIDDEEVTLELRSLPDGQPIATATLGRGPRRHSFTRLMPRLMAVELQTRFGTFTEQVDLSAGEAGHVRMEPDLIVISGTVFRGERPHPANLTFLAVDRSIVEARTDPDGQYEVVSLVPLRNVTVALELNAFAPGYYRMREPVRDKVRDDDFERRYEIRLRPIGDQVAARLELADGRPAAGARLLLVDSLASGASLFSSQADGNGLVYIPRATHGVVLIRHPDAAILIRDWRPDKATGELSWTLSHASDRPLTVRVLDPWGEEPSPRAWLALWIDGKRLSGRVLGWLAGGRPAADDNGYWSMANLPQSPVALLAWPARKRGAGAAGLLDALATEVVYPWPDLVELSASE